MARSGSPIGASVRSSRSPIPAPPAEPWRSGRHRGAPWCCNWARGCGERLPVDTGAMPALPPVPALERESADSGGSLSLSTVRIELSLRAHRFGTWDRLRTPPQEAPHTTRQLPAGAPFSSCVNDGPNVGRSERCLSPGIGLVDLGTRRQPGPAGAARLLRRSERETWRAR